jgi:hypothetical protein
MNKNNNYIKKIFRKIKENFMSDDIKDEIKIELIDPLFLEMKNFILPHYVIFIMLFLIIIILLLYLIIIMYNINLYHINKY